MRTKSRWVSLTAALAVAALAGCSEESTSPSVSSPALAAAATGNGAPSGAHYTLNVIGVPKSKSADFDGGNGHRIFVGLGRTGAAANTRINLSVGDFAVTDANGTDGTAAFQLPNPDPDGDGTTAYSVYVRALGKPGGKATAQSCYEDATGTWCAVDFPDGVEPITLERSKGGSKFTNVSKDLLFVDYCTAWAAGDDGIPGTEDDECTTVDQVALFSSDLADYFWGYDNEGLKLAQVPVLRGGDRDRLVGPRRSSSDDLLLLVRAHVPESHQHHQVEPQHHQRLPL